MALVPGMKPDFCQLVRYPGIAEAGERLLCVGGEGVGGGDGLVADPTWAKLVRTLAVEFGQDGAFVVG
jgi:hypothetical protein